MPDDDDLADQVRLADERARSGRARLVRGVQLGPRAPARVPAQPRLLAGDDWWGVGPGAHSHVGGVRWWNVKHPARVRRAARPPAHSPAQAREVLDDATRRLERVLLEVRLREGLVTERALADAVTRRRRWSRGPGRAGRVCVGSGGAHPAGPAAGRPGGPQADDRRGYVTSRKVSG